MFDFGDLTVLTASEAGIDKMHMLRKPIAFKKAMLDAKHEFEVDMERSGWQPRPTDPRRRRRLADSPTRSRHARPRRGHRRPPASPRRRAAAARADPDEVTRTLANLADLRDRGAITPRGVRAQEGRPALAALIDRSDPGPPGRYDRRDPP